MDAEPLWDALRRCAEPVFKTKKCWKKSTLFDRIHKGLGEDAMTFLDSTPFVSVSWIFYTLTGKPIPLKNAL
jgi:hypothetical protein